MDTVPITEPVMNTVPIIEPAPLELLTHSRMSSNRRCPRSHWYHYELCMVPDSEEERFTFGKAMHEAVAAWRVIRTQHPNSDPAEPGRQRLREIVQEPYLLAKVAATFEAYCWYYQAETAVWPHVEVPFELPLRNPETGGVSRTFNRGGKIDAIDGEHRLWEMKTTRDDISSGSDYWLRLQHDPQLSLYWSAAHELGFSTEAAVYDVVGEPQQRPKQIPELDENGLKIVILDATGERVFNKNGTPRQTAGEGLSLVSRPETPEEYGARILEAICEEPERYFVRRIITRTDKDLEEYAHELWAQGQEIMWRRRTNSWGRHVSQITCKYCSYTGPCLQGITIDPLKPPVGYRYVDNPHQELQEDSV